MPATEKVLWRGEPSSIWRGTQTLIEGRSHAKTPPQAIGKEGVRRENDKYPGRKMATLTAPLGGVVFRRKKTK